MATQDTRRKQHSRQVEFFLELTRSDADPPGVRLRDGNFWFERQQGVRDFTVDTQIPRTDQIGFVLQFLDTDDNLQNIGPAVGGISDDVRQGPSMFWKSGETGTLEFNASNTQDFSLFTELLTDGIDDSLLVFWRWERDGGFEGGGRLESETFGLTPDLIGNTIDRIRMSVSEVLVEPIDPFLSDVKLHVTYDVEGSSVPEPTSLLLLLSGTLWLRCKIL